MNGDPVIRRQRRSLQSTVSHTTVTGSRVNLATTYRWEQSWLRPRRLLFAAAMFHLAVTSLVCGLGHYGVFPGAIDNYGILSFASDGIEIRAEAVQLSNQLRGGNFREWFSALAPFHIKLHSVAFTLLGPLFGSTIMSAEPVNLLCYLAILTLAFLLGQEVFNRRAGLVAATVVAVWPSFLLHTTQLLKDPMFIAGMLAFILINVRLVSRESSWLSSLLTATAGGVTVAAVWLARDTMKEVLIAITLLSGVLALGRQFARNWFPGKSAVSAQSAQSASADSWRAALPSLAGIALLIGLTVGVTQLIPKFKRPPGSAIANTTAGTDNVGLDARRQKRDRFFEQQPTTTNPWSRFVRRVGKLRQGFVIEFSDAGSNIDSNVQIRSTVDFVSYLPRAAMIGFFAPFPNMWIETGNKVSRGGRLLSGVEMLGMYLAQVLAVIGLWSGRRRLSVWFLSLVVVMGAVSLGLVVVNIGALYRMRYVFVILLILLASEGARFTIELYKEARLSAGNSERNRLEDLK